MADDFDDLLDDFADLEAEQPIKSQKSVKPKTIPASNDAMSVVLDAAKTAQEAAAKSQEVAEANLKLTEELRAQERELTEANFNWRQSFRSAVATLNKTKGQFVVIMTLTLITCLIAIGAMSFLYYSIQQKEQAMKGEILDLLQNEQALFNKDMNIKVDQITSMMEMVQYQVEQALMKDATLHENFSQANASVKTAETPEMVNLENEHDATLEHKVETEHVTHETDEKHEQIAAEIKTGEHSTDQNERHAQPLMHATSASMDESSMQVLKDSIKQDLSAMEQTLLKAIASVESKHMELSKQIDSLKHHANTTAQTTQKHEIVSTNDTVAGLNAEQNKQLRNIHWWVSQQDKAIKRIEKSLKEPTSSKDDSKELTSRLGLIDDQMKQMRTQQTLIETQLKKLQINVNQLVERANTSYSYKAKEDPKP